jgi:hypothetical protein
MPFQFFAEADDTVASMFYVVPASGRSKKHFFTFVHRRDEILQRFAIAGIAVCREVRSQ